MISPLMSRAAVTLHVPYLLHETSYTYTPATQSFPAHIYRTCINTQTIRRYTPTIDLSRKGSTSQLNREKHEDHTLYLAPHAVFLSEM
jgi:hypothetical protein